VAGDAVGSERIVEHADVAGRIPADPDLPRIAVGLTLVIVAASLIAGPHRPDSEKLSPYECGFEAFDDARRRFDVRFYLVSLLFIIFDSRWRSCFRGPFPWAMSASSGSGRW